MGSLMDWTWRVREREVKDIAQISSLSNWVSSHVIYGDGVQKEEKTNMMRSVWDTQKWRYLGDNWGKRGPVKQLQPHFATL